MENATNCVTRSTWSSVPAASHLRPSHGSFESLAIPRNVRTKQSATAAVTSVSGDQRSPGPSNSAGAAERRAASRPLSS